MPRLAAKFERGNFAGPYRAFGLSIDRRLELAALEATVNAIDAQTNAIVAALENRLGLRLDTLNDNLIAAYRTGAATGSTTDPTTLLSSTWYR